MRYGIPVEGDSSAVFCLTTGRRLVGRDSVLLVLLATILAAGPSAGAESPRFIESSARLGVVFEHRHSGTGLKYMHETVGSGVAVLDLDGDGRLDIYFVQGASRLPKGEKPGLAPNRLFRQTAEGLFVDITQGSGAGDPGYGMGVAYGDVDRDGDPDLYLTNLGRNTLLRNLGGGRFEDVTEAAGVGGDQWSSAAGFFDADGDGDLDLYVVNYVDFTFDNHKWCGNAKHQIRSYCHPDVYAGVTDVLYRNDGDFRFTDVSREAGLRASADAKGLGLAFADFDRNGILDIFVANDSSRNHLYLGGEGLRYEENGLLAGVAFNGSGEAEASMGVAVDDVDGDGLADIFLTHLGDETNTLYHSLGGGLFHDGTSASGLGIPSLPWVGFGTLLFDHDNDGDLDVFVTNGEVVDNIELYEPKRSYRQPSQLFDNLGDGRFSDLSAQLGLEELLVGRGAAAGDLDGDGDVDVVITQNNGPARVLLNQTGSNNRSIGIRLHGVTSNLEGFGARVEILVGDRRQSRLLHSSSSYLSQSAPEIYFGLGTWEGSVEVIVRWPSGRVDEHVGLEAGYLVSLTEGSNDREEVPFR